MSATTKIEQRIKSLAKIEGEYRTEIKRAQADMKHDMDHRTRYERMIKKYQRKIDRIAPKIRHLREVRANVRAR